MEAAMSNRLMALADGDVVALDDARGTTLRVGRGALWVTQDRDARDLLLTPGDAWTVERDGLTLVEARSDASLLLVGNVAGDARPVHRPRMRWYDHLMAGLHAMSRRRAHWPWV
jgi:hypothetical protein